ncbi:hypothetical protein GPECTOR_42g855 [Gonium pectorale]|uniref:Uncharacterized protein n=1 Tax=Gonium pectorale TaxID=33097 RepID=A0A150G9X4_GONPE|nr:hypothetical protein GPECTOR_42g855 [Gonium pectorale]|eukprot:KXZ46644.1 hypothetical protein GPECTOR_42g855 [Gonium pectorale]
MRDYLAVWAPQYNEYDYYVAPEAVHGTLPDELLGSTLFLIGPGLTEGYGTSVRDPSDADGMVCSLAIGESGRVFFRNRYVRTPSFVTEQALGRRITRGLHDRGAAAVSGLHQQPVLEQPVAASMGRVATGGSGGTGSSGSVSGRPGGSDRGRHSRHDDGGWAQEDEPGARDKAARTRTTDSAAPSTPKPIRLDPLALLGLPPMPPLSSLFNPLDTSFRAPVNANIVFWGGRLLAFSEGGSLPYELHKLSLETVGPFDAGGTLADIGRLVGGYKIVPAPTSSSSSASPPSSGSASSSSSPPSSSQPPAQRLVLMGCAQSGPDVLLRWVELGQDGRPVGQPTAYRLPGAAAMGVKDFWVTQHHYVVVQAPLDLNPQRFVTRASVGSESFIECFDWDPSRPARVHLVPRPHSATAPAPTAAATARTDSPPQERRKSSVLVWPPKGPDAIVVDAPPLLPSRAVGCYSLDPEGGQLVLDAVCTQRAVTAAATAAIGGVSTSTSAGTALASLAGRNGGSLAGAAYHNLYLSASVAEGAGARWAPAQVLVRLRVPAQFGVPSAAGRVEATAASSAGSNNAGVAGWRGATAVGGRRCGSVGTEAWAPGDRAFLGPVVFVPRGSPGAAGTKAQHPQSLPSSPPSRARAGPGDGAAGGPASPLPPLESEVLAAARQAAAAAAAEARLHETAGWLVVTVHDAEAGRASLCVLDAADVAGGPVAVVELPHHLPHVRAVSFTRTYCGPGVSAPPDWRPRGAAA